MWRDDHLPQPATEASRAVWARAMNREVRERWPQVPLEELVAEVMAVLLMRLGGQR